MNQPAKHIEGGFFLTPRVKFESGIWKEPHKCRLFELLIGKANHCKDKPQRIAHIEVGYGQYLRSYRKLQEDLEYIEDRKVKRHSTWKIMRLVKELINEGRIQVEQTDLGTLFSVSNYHIYQSFESYEHTETNHTPNSVQTDTKHFPNNNNHSEHSDNIYTHTVPVKRRRVKKEYEPDVHRIYQYYLTHIRSGARLTALERIDKLLDTHPPETLLRSAMAYAAEVKERAREYRKKPENFFRKGEEFENYLTQATAGRYVDRAREILKGDEPQLQQQAKPLVGTDGLTHTERILLQRRAQNSKSAYAE